jgi:hypothetical protein
LSPEFAAADGLTSLLAVGVDHWPIVGTALLSSHGVGHDKLVHFLCESFLIMAPFVARIKKENP